MSYQPTDADAVKTMKSAVILALFDSYDEHHLTIDKSGKLVDAVVERIFQSSTRWAVKKHLEALEK